MPPTPKRARKVQARKPGGKLRKHEEEVLEFLREHMRAVAPAPEEPAAPAA